MSLASSWGFRILAPVCGLLVTPIVLDGLGAERFGSYVLANSLVAWLGLLDPGIAASLRVALARTAAVGGALSARSALFAAVAKVQVLFALAMCVGCGLLVFALGGDPESNGLAFLLGGAAALIVASGAHTAALASAQLIHLEQLVRGVRTLSRAILTLVFFFSAGAGLVALGCAHFVAAAVSSALAVLLCRRNLSSLFPPGPADWPALRVLAPSGAWISVGSLAGLAIASSDRIVIGKLVGLEALTAFSITASLFVLCEGLLTAAVDSARPALAESLGLRSLGAARRIHRHISAATVGLSVVGAACVLSINRSFVAAWTGSETHAGFTVELWLSATLVLQVWILAHRALLTAQLDVRASTLTRGFEAGLNLALSITLAPIYGLAGVAAATAFAALATSAWRLPLLASRHVGQDSLQDLPNVVLLACAMTPVVWLSRLAAQSIDGLAGAAVALLATGTCGAVLLWSTTNEDLRLRVRFWRPTTA